MIEDDSKIARDAMFQAIETQIADNSPPEVKKTLKRLRSLGHSRQEALDLIGCALSEEVFHVVKYEELYNEDRYVKNLKNLPQLPWDEKSRSYRL